MTLSKIISVEFRHFKYLVNVLNVRCSYAVFFIIAMLSNILTLPFSSYKTILISSFVRVELTILFILKLSLPINTMNSPFAQRVDQDCKIWECIHQLFLIHLPNDKIMNSPT